MIQWNVEDEIRVWRRTEYKFLNRKVKGLLEKIKRKVDEEFGIKVSEKYNENNKLFGRKLRKREEE